MVYLTLQDPNLDGIKVLLVQEDNELIESYIRVHLKLGKVKNRGEILLLRLIGLLPHGGVRSPL
jgi:hypothetical protein